MLNRKTLSDWVLLQIAYEGSARILAKKIGCHHSTICAWRDGLSDVISEKNLIRLARYRNEALSQTTAWLDDGKKEESELIQELRKASPEVLAQASRLLGAIEPRLILNQLDLLPQPVLAEIATKIYALMPSPLSLATVSNGKLFNGLFIDGFDRKMCSPVGRLIIAELEASVTRGEFADFQSALARFCDICPFAPEYRSRDIPMVLALLDGRCRIANQDIIGPVAIALSDFSGDSRYTCEYLDSIQEQTLPQDWDRGCEKGGVSLA